MQCAFIIPLHPKHYNYMYNLLNLLDKHSISIDIYIVFSSEQDYEQFLRKDRIKKIVIPHVITSSIVTYKKFFALETLKDNTNYDYFIVCDAEITVIPENFTEKNILSKLSSIYDNKLIYAGATNNKLAIDITKTSCSVFKNSNLDKLTDNYTLYFWWSDIPVYKREHLHHFFSLVKYDHITWCHFDHIIYLSYLIVYHDFTLLNVTTLLDHSWSLESYNTTDSNKINILKELKYGFSYISPLFYKNNMEQLKNEGSFLIYHLDR